MNEYKELWRVRKKQLIIITVIMLVIGVLVMLDGSILEGILIWILGTWIVGTLVASFSKTGGRASSVIGNFWTGWISGTMAASSGGSTFWVFLFFIKLIKFMFGLVALVAILLFEFIKYPIMTVYYFIKSR